jgi:orotate phosphoribosyltransferase
MEHYQQDVADALLDIGAVGFTPHSPVTFKSGILSPIYVDSRRLSYHPKQWKIVIDGFRMWIREHAIAVDVIAGIETGGIPHGAALGYIMDKPSLFVRKQPKEHGTRRRVEGGDVTHRRVLLVEDLITTGGSSLSGVQALRAEGAVVTDCIAIVSYEFEEALAAFRDAGVSLHVLAPFSVIVKRALTHGLFDDATLDVLNTWHANPYGWRGTE